MATTDLKLDDAGSLPRPGLIGRIVRLAFGVLCASYVVGIVDVADDLISDDGHIRAVIWNGVLLGLFLISYVVNIGFSRAWGKWPAIVSAGFLIAIAGYSQLTQGTFESNILARAVWGWEIYLFSHLGGAFFVSSIIGTPGCEMRAFHDLYSRLTGIPTKEHYCPVGPLHSIDRWESARRKR